MNFCGIICEFNPFHNGHEHLITQVKQQTGNDVICLMSGDFVQRGTPAIEDKYERAKKAILAGASAVLELPTFFACSNAENFAYGAIKIFKALNIKHLAFGIENTNLEILQKVAKLKFENSIQFKTAFKNEIQNGINFNTALKRSIAKSLNDDSLLDVLNKPNNILAIEYLTAMLKLNHNMEVFAIERTDNGYNSYIANNKFISASAIRSMISQNENYESFVPPFAKITKPFSALHNLIFENHLILKIKQSSEKELSNLYDYTEGIEYRIKKASQANGNLNDIIEAVATPRYRIPRVQKLLLYPLLSINKNIAKSTTSSKSVSKVLAINKNNKQLISTYNKNKITLIVTNKDYNLLNSYQKKIIDIDLKASELYNTITNSPEKSDKKIGTIFL